MVDWFCLFTFLEIFLQYEPGKWNSSFTASALTLFAFVPTHWMSVSKRKKVQARQQAACLHNKALMAACQGRMESALKLQASSNAAHRRWTNDMFSKMF